MHLLSIGITTHQGEERQKLDVETALRKGHDHFIDAHLKKFKKFLQNCPGRVKPFLPIAFGEIDVPQAPNVRQCAEAVLIANTEPVIR